MRYYLRDSSFIIRGRFRICSSGTNGGIRDCTTLINHQVADAFNGDPDSEIEEVAYSLGFSPADSAVLLTAVPMHTLCILSCDPLTVFITAGVTHPDPEIGIIPDNTGFGTINIIIVSSEGLSDQGLVDSVITVTEAKSLALRNAGYSFAGTLTDAVITATETSGNVRYTGSATGIGQRIHASVLFGVSEALKRQEGKVSRRNPSFFIWSSIGGNHWIEWQKKQCPYYPCHFPGQKCDFCYCPLYPCGDTTLGDWVEKPGRSPVWSCARCTFNHHPTVTRHLIRNPEASLPELMAVFSRK